MEERDEPSALLAPPHNNRMSPESESASLLSSSSSQPQPNTRSAISRALSLVTVEPVLFLESVAFGLKQNLITNLTVDKLCSVYFGFDAETCRNLDAGNHTTEQDQVQRLASKYNMYMLWAEYIPAVFASLLIGSLGDARGRRLPVILSLTGCLLTGLCYLANAYWWWLPPQLLYLSVLPVGFVGGFLGVIITTSAYLSASTGMRSRTVSLSVVEWIRYSASPLGIYLSSVLFSSGGYVLAYGFYVLITAVAVLYLLFCVGEPSGIQEVGDPAYQGDDTKVGMVAQLQRTLAMPMKIRRSGRAGVIIAWHVIVMLLWVCMIVTRTQYFLYERKVFGWKLQQYTDWMLFDSLIKASGILLVMPFCSYYLRVQDAMLGFVGSVSMLFFYTVFGTAPSAWVLYVATTVSLCSIFPVLTSRGAISKLVPKTDLGATFALLSVVECLVALVVPPLYTLIYNSTLDVFPGTLFLVMAGVAVIECCIHVWLLTHFDDHPSR